MKKNAILLADTRMALIGNILLQVKATNDSLFDEAIIYHNGNVLDSDKSIMRSILPCRFIKYEPPLPDDLFELPRYKRFSKLMFARYEMFNLISEYRSIVWLDTDILIQGDIADLVKIADKSGFAILSEDPKNKSADKTDTMRTCFDAPIPGYNLDKYLYCTGTIVVTDSLVRHDSFTRWCYEKTIEWQDTLLQPDQGVINALIQEFSISVQSLGGSFARFPMYGVKLDSATYIHSWGQAKFWNDYYLQQRFPKWRQYYDEWILMGGSKFDNAVFQPDISVIIPIYKPNILWLKECLTSILRQINTEWERYSNFEILLIAEPFDIEAIKTVSDSFDDPRIRIEINSERLGLAASLNKGIKLAQGRYIVRIDADDIAVETRLFKQKEYLDTHLYVNMCVSDYIYFGDMNEGRHVFEGNLSKAWSLITCPFDHPTIMFRRDFFIENELFYDEKMQFAEDWELWIRAFDKGMVVGCIKEELTQHRWHNDNAGQTDKSIEAMDKLAKSNFARLGIQVSDDFTHALRPWSGKLTESNCSKLEDIFAQAISANESLHLYDTKSLQYVFALRLNEAKSGVLPIVVISTPPMANQRPGKLNAAIKFAIMPLWRPIHRRLIVPLIRIESGVSNLQSQTLQIEMLTNEVQELKMMLESQNEVLLAISQQLVRNERGNQ